MKNRKGTQQQAVTIAIVAVCLLLIAGIWLIDVVLRLFRNPRYITAFIFDEREISDYFCSLNTAECPIVQQLRVN